MSAICQVPHVPDVWLLCSIRLPTDSRIPTSGASVGGAHESEPPASTSIKTVLHPVVVSVLHHGSETSKWMSNSSSSAISGQRMWHVNTMDTCSTSAWGISLRGWQPGHDDSSWLFLVRGQSHDRIRLLPRPQNVEPECMKKTLQGHTRRRWQLSRACQKHSSGVNNAADVTSHFRPSPLRGGESDQDLFPSDVTAVTC